MTSKTHLNFKKQKQKKEPNKNARGKGKQKVQAAGPAVEVNRASCQPNLQGKCDGLPIPVAEASDLKLISLRYLQ